MAKGNLKNVRVAQPKWDLAKKVAARRGDTVSGVLNASLTRYIKRHATEAELAELDADQPARTTAAA